MPGSQLIFFFVLSGFLLAESVEKRSLAEYARNRFLQIFPGLWVCLIITGIVAPLLFGIAPGVRYVSTNAWLLGGVYATIPGMFSNNPITSANGALWTLTWELWCYISLVGLALCGRRRQVVAIAMFIFFWIAFALKIGTAASLADKAAITSPFRLATFFYSGVLLHLYRDRVPLSGPLAFASGAALAGAAALGTVALHKPGGLFYIIAPGALGYLVIYAAARLPFTRINTKTDLSYGLYIYGTFMIQVLVAIGLHRIVDYAAFAATSVLVTLPLALLSWHLVERPAMSLRRTRAAAIQPAE